MHFADDASVRPNWLYTHQARCLFSLSGRYEEHETTLTGDVERVRAEDFARGGNILPRQNGSLIQMNLHVGRRGDFVLGAGQPC